MKKNTKFLILIYKIIFQLRKAVSELYSVVSIHFAAFFPRREFLSIEKQFAECSIYK